MHKEISLVFPHQLFAASPLLDLGHDIWLIEEYLFFRQYNFHKVKLAFHRASMKSYADYLQGKGLSVYYVDAASELSDIRQWEDHLAQMTVNRIHVVDPTDDWLEKRLRRTAGDVEVVMYDNPMFLNTKEELTSFFGQDKKSYLQTSFYTSQRKKLAILLDDAGKPLGGKWTYDADNRKKYPKGKVPPPVQLPDESPYWDEAVDYVNKEFGDNIGEVTLERVYPIDHSESGEWLDDFLLRRFHEFGPYEDAIVREHGVLNHSLLSPLINSGLISPDKVIERAVGFAQRYDVPLNSTEGFVRQIIGWREFMRGMYEYHGRQSRTQNFWGFTRKIPASLYDGTTGIEPVDATIRKVLRTGYCHHIERLMILGNFMLLCEFDPREVYRWFMELFIDAYDWVMVPNVFGMSQFADGGSLATKPYISGSNYLKKMSNYSKGPWQETWDGLFWSFVSRHRDFFGSNPRSVMMIRNLDRMDSHKRDDHMRRGSEFLEELDSLL